MVKSKNTPNELFNEFLNEEALKPRQKVEVALEIIKPETVSYKLAVPTPTTEEEIKNQWRVIRNFFRSGENPKRNESTGLMPVLPAPYLKKDEITTDYPVFLSVESKFDHCPFSDLLENTFKKIFKEKEAGILLQNLPRIENFVRKYVVDAGNFCPFDVALGSAIKDISKIKIKGEDRANFLKDIEKFKDSLPQSGMLLGFSQQTPVHFLVHLLKYQTLEKRKKFISEIHVLKSGLNDLLSVEKSEGSKDHSSGWGIADSLIEFKKLDTLMPERASESMPEKRYERIVNCISTLDSAESLLQNYNGLIFIGKTLSENSNFNWNKLLEGIEVKVAPTNESCTSASNGFKNHIAGLVKLMTAVRIAELEIKNKYDEEIHRDFFKRFNWHYFTEEESSLCPPVVLIEETQNLLGKELQHFSTLIASNKPVKVLAINEPSPFKINFNDSEDELPSYQQELSSLTISHRGAFTLQSALHNPVHLLKGIESGLASSTPALFHILISPDSDNTSTQNFINISSAVEGRQFPLFTYSAGENKWGSRFDINANPQSYLDWPEYTFEITNENKGTDKLELPFTFVDFYAVNKSNSESLFLVPPSYWSDDLIPLSEYLKLSTDKLYAKVPFIWLVDNEDTLQKVAVPYSLVIEAKERLDFWNFIQELGGVNSFHVEQAVNRTRNEMQEQKEKEIKDIETKFEKQIEEVRTSAAGEAMDRLAGILLDLDSITSLPSVSKISKPSSSPEAEESKTSVITPAKVETTEKVVEISGEAWLETFKCTSCNECTDKYPRAFKYNGDKQAYMEDITTVTYAQLVKAAEACPAKCIHPGMPLNPNEPGLEELIVKAKPFN